MRAKRPEIDLFVVQRNRQGVIAERGRAIDQLDGGVGNRVFRIV